MKNPVPMLLIASLLGGCIAVPPPPNRSEADPADPSARAAALPRLKPNLIASTRIFLDPSVGEGAQKMDHSKMQGMGGMEGMDHSKMPGMQKVEAKPQGMENMPGMDHSKMPGMSGKKDGAMPASWNDPSLPCRPCPAFWNDPSFAHLRRPMDREKCGCSR